jgi:hypothetical protein
MQVNHPEKQLIRDWLNREREQVLPSITEIRRKLGWEMLPNNQQKEHNDDSRYD